MIVQIIVHIEIKRVYKAKTGMKKEERSYKIGNEGQ